MDLNLIIKVLAFIAISICVINARNEIKWLSVKFINNFIIFYTILFILSGFVNDTLLASIVIPIIAISAKSEDKVFLVLTAGFAIASGAKITYWGSGENLVAYLLTISKTHQDISMLNWFSMFFPVIVINYIIPLGVLEWIKVKKLIK